MAGQHLWQLEKTAKMSSTCLLGCSLPEPDCNVSSKVASSIFDENMILVYWLSVQRPTAQTY